MIEPKEFKDISYDFENLNIYIHKASATPLSNALETNEPLNTALTGLWHNLNFYSYDNNNGLNPVGEIFLALRNQADNDNTLLFFSFSLRIIAKNEKDKASVFTKTIQGLFEWIKSKSDNLEISDANNNKFIVPPFLYSRGRFSDLF